MHPALAGLHTVGGTLCKLMGKHRPIAPDQPVKLGRMHPHLSLQELEHHWAV